MYISHEDLRDRTANIARNLRKTAAQAQHPTLKLAHETGALLAKCVEAWRQLAAAERGDGSGPRLTIADPGDRETLRRGASIYGRRNRTQRVIPKGPMSQNTADIIAQRSKRYAEVAPAIKKDREALTFVRGDPREKGTLGDVVEFVAWELLDGAARGRNLRAEAAARVDDIIGKTDIVITTPGGRMRRSVDATWNKEKPEEPRVVRPIGVRFEDREKPLPDDWPPKIPRTVLRLDETTAAIYATLQLGEVVTKGTHVTALDNWRAAFLIADTLDPMGTTERAMHFRWNPREMQDLLEKAID